MSRLDNVKRIILEDFDDEHKDTVGKLATILNYFMENVVSTVNGELDYDNLKRQLVVIEIITDFAGNPINGTNRFSAQSGAKGALVVSARGANNTSTLPVASPFIAFDPTQEPGIYVIKKAFGLLANTKYRLLVELIF